MRASRQLFDFPAGADQLLLPDRTGLTAGRTIRAGAAVLAEERQSDRGEKGQLADHSVTPAKLPASTGAATDREALEPHGVADFEDLRVSDSGIGHVGVDRARARKAWPGTSAAAHGFVVAEMLVAKQHIVHGALTAGRQPERLEQGVDQPLAGLDIATDHRRCALGWVNKRWVQDPRRHHPCNRREQPFVERHGLGHQQAQHVQHRAPHHRWRRVEVAGMDRARAGEVDPGAAICERHGHGQGSAVIELLGCPQHARGPARKHGC